MSINLLKWLSRKYNHNCFFDMVTHKIVVIRGREISVIFYFSDISGCTVHPTYTIHTVQQHTALFFGHKDAKISIIIRIRILPVVDRHLG